MPGFISIPYNDIDALEKVLEDKNVAGFLVEPIQGEAGVVVPDDGYLSKQNNYVKKQMFFLLPMKYKRAYGRTGKMLACDHENVRPDILILGKALSGGMMPVSAVLSR